MLTLSDMLVRTLKQKAIYWREVAQRDRKSERKLIMKAELESLTSVIKAEILLLIIAEYVEGLADPPVPKNQVITRRGPG